MRLNKVVLVTGVSGAGKTSAMAVLEDMGYYCIDRFPVALLDDLIELMIAEQTDSYFQNFALSVTAKDFLKFNQAFENIDCELTVLHLDATEESLLLRYKYNRRNHPLLVMKTANSLEEAIRIEMDEFSIIRDYATIIIDTSHLTVQDLSKRIQSIFAISARQGLSISFLSFGYRHGLPQDADLVFDVRFLKNPYWEETLRGKTGNTREVYEYVIDNPKTQDYLERLQTFLDYSIQQYRLESKHHLTIAIGCTGGQHRSVSVANWLYRYYYDNYNVYITHRDAPEDEL